MNDMENLRENLNLTSHPEGGAFRELFKSSEVVIKAEGGEHRSAITHIYFHLEKGEVSRFHKVNSDEIWHLYEGEGVTLYLWGEGDLNIREIKIGSSETPHCYVVPAGVWQAAEPVGESSLAGCSVGPGFEFEDFRLIDSKDDEAAAIRAIRPDLEKFL